MDCCDWLWFIESLNDADFAGAPQYEEPLRATPIKRQKVRSKRSRTALMTRLRRGLARLRGRCQVSVAESVTSPIGFSTASQGEPQQRPAA